MSGCHGAGENVAESKAGKGSPACDRVGTNPVKCPLAVRARNASAGPRRCVVASHGQESKYLI